MSRSLAHSTQVTILSLAASTFGCTGEYDCLRGSNLNSSSSHPTGSHTSTCPGLDPQKTSRYQLGTERAIKDLQASDLEWKGRGVVSPERSHLANVVRDEALSVEERLQVLRATNYDSDLCYFFLSPVNGKGPRLKEIPLQDFKSILLASPEATRCMLEYRASSFNTLDVERARILLELPGLKFFTMRVGPVEGASASERAIYIMDSWAQFEPDALAALIVDPKCAFAAALNRPLEELRSEQVKLRLAEVLKISIDEVNTLMEESRQRR